MAAVAGIIGALASVGGTIVSMAGASYQAEADAQRQEYEARGKERKASEEAAVGQRNARERRREAELLGSRQRAVAASSGASATDPSVLQIMGNTAGEGELNAKYAEYEAKARQGDLITSAENDRVSAKNTRTAGKYKAFGTALEGISSFAKNYG